MLRLSRSLINRGVQRKMGTGVYAQKLFKRWESDKESVSQEWQEYFQRHQASMGQNRQGVAQQTQHTDPQVAQLVTSLYNLIRAYRYRGHEEADVDPLQLDSTAKKQSGYKETEGYMDLAKFGIQECHMDTVVLSGEHKESLGYFLEERPSWTVRQIIDRMSQIYCGKTGYEFYHLDQQVPKEWLRREIEVNSQPSTVDQKRQTLDSLLKNHQFNEFMKNTFSTSKRFGIEGLDSMISGLEALVEHSGSAHDMQHMVLGMAHRGRLNTLAIVFDKPYDEIFAEFQDLKGEAMVGLGGDVKYHLGATTHKQLKSGKNMELTILPNPSHLETVDPVVYGTCRAIQDFTGDSQGSKTFGVVIHGDAAFAGQGVVYESLQFQNLKDYSSGGLIHIVSNNQIGFTTTPADARTGLYCTEIAKAIGAPIFHVNADQPDEVDRIMRLAFDFRQKFKRDVVIDLIGYRKFGHNELDQPSFTQPLMYKKVAKMTAVYTKYKQQLQEEGIIDSTTLAAREQDIYAALKAQYLRSKTTYFDFSKWQSKAWEEIMSPRLLGKNIKDTGVDTTKLAELGSLLNDIPSSQVTLHPQLAKIYQLRLKTIQEGKQIDYGTAEQLAFGSLVQEGYGVRLSGQDVERGTFSHRHAVLHDQQRDHKFIPIHQLLSKEELHRATFCNSHLSEYGVMGFEFGYSQSNPNFLVMWEAQFGDFSNEAQIMIDNYVSSCERKWGVQSGLTLLLPHGMDGQGPEHSSARMERYLALMDDDPLSVDPLRKEPITKQIYNANMQVVQCSTAAQYFHVLRRQMKRQFRKPLVVFNSKKLLRFKPATSNLDEFALGLRFQRVIGESQPESLVPAEQMREVVVCSGQAYYEALETRQQHSINDVAIIRVEQIAPFPYEHFKQLVQQYPNAKFTWFQEEHQNMGAWTYVEPRINAMLSECHHSPISYVGRRISASPAAGTQKQHKAEQKQILNTLFNL